MTEQQISTADHDLGVETLRAVILGSLTELATLLDLTSDMVHGYQRAGIGFLTADGRQVLDELMRQERRDRLEHAKQGIKVSGASPAPGNIRAWATNAEIHVRLAGVHHEVMTRLQRSGVCLAWRTPLDPDPLLLMARIGILVAHTTSLPVLNDVDRELQQLVDAAKRLVDGDSKKPHPDPCPHCGRKTLVIYLTDDVEDRVIRCEKDPDTGEYERCLCKDPYCLCRVKHKRHEWWADPTKAKAEGARSWWHLSDDLNRIRRATQQETP